MLAADCRSITFSRPRATGRSHTKTRTRDCRQFGLRHISKKGDKVPARDGVQRGGRGKRESGTTVSELYFPIRHSAGLTVRLFDLERRRWSISWAFDDCRLDPAPTVGGFDGNTGDFYAEDHDQGRPIKVRYVTPTGQDQEPARGGR